MSSERRRVSTCGNMRSAAGFKAASATSPTVRRSLSLLIHLPPNAPRFRVIFGCAGNAVHARRAPCCQVLAKFFQADRNKLFAWTNKPNGIFEVENIILCEVLVDVITFEGQSRIVHGHGRKMLLKWSARPRVMALYSYCERSFRRTSSDWMRTMTAKSQIPLR